MSFPVKTDKGDGCASPEKCGSMYFRCLYRSNMDGAGFTPSFVRYSVRTSKGERVAVCDSRRRGTSSVSGASRSVGLNRRTTHPERLCARRSEVITTASPVSDTAGAVAPLSAYPFSSGKKESTKGVSLKASPLRAAS